MGALNSSNTAVPEVTALNVSQYVGRWYQMHASVTVKDTMELGGNCVVADYGIISFNNSVALTVENICQPFGRTIRVSGFATPSPSKPGELDVALGPPGHPPSG